MMNSDSDEDQSDLEGEEKPGRIFTFGFRGRYLGAVVAVIAVVGVIAALLAGQGYIPLSPISIIGVTMLVIPIVVCCYTLGLQASLYSKMPQYAQQESLFQEGMTYYNSKEWKKALDVFLEVMGPKKDHKRALYYSARCYEQLNDWANVKKFTSLYLAMQPKDREAWEMLAAAHTRLFEYDEAEAANARASRLSYR